MKYLGNPQSGSAANVTASHNTYGQYYRNRRTPVNPRSTAQTTVRAIFSTLAKAWKQLTDAQRAGWKAIAQGQPRTDGLGQTIILSSFQEFMSVNCKRENFGDAAIQAPPAYPTIEDIGAITLTATGGLLKAGFANAFATGSLTKIGIYASRQTSAGTGYASDLKLVEVTGAAPVTPLDFTANYTTRFGAPITGDRIFVQLEPYNAGFTLPGEITSKVST